MFGDIESADIVKIHINTGKLTLQFYENFSDLLPVISRRIKIDMRSQDVRIFDYDDADRQYLFMKSLFLPEDHEDFEAQSTFDSEVSRLREFDFSGYGPDANLFDKTLAEKNIVLGWIDPGLFDVCFPNFWGKESETQAGKRLQTKINLKYNVFTDV